MYSDLFERQNQFVGGSLNVNGAELKDSYNVIWLLGWTITQWGMMRVSIGDLSLERSKLLKCVLQHDFMHFVEFKTLNRYD